MEFQGFTPDTYRFLMELGFQNEKPFFEANRARYTAGVQEPLRALAAALMPTLLRIDPLFNPDPKRAVSRIYRDARRTHGLAPYRDHAWLSFKHMDSHIAETFCIYFEIQPDGYGYGMGSYGASAEVMEPIRARMLADPARFLALSENPALEAYTVTGDMYKRDRYPLAPAELKPYLNRKSLSWCYFNTDLRRTYDGAALFAETETAMRNMAAMYQFLTLGSLQ